MSVRATTDVAEIVERLDRKLAEDPVLHTVLGTVRADEDGLRAAGWCAWDEGGSLAARAAARWPVTVTDGWADLAGLAQALAALASLAGIAGPQPIVEDLLDRLGRPATIHHSQRLFRLDELTEPVGVAGAARPADADDLGLLAQWLAGFAVDAHERAPSAEETRTQAERILSVRHPWLWVDAAGEAVSLAVAQQAAFGVARIGPVYTPPDRRGHGFASAATAQATRHILAAGDVPVLFTDLTNPTSNKIYQQLGYRPVADRTQVFLD
ncbi:GNAT family N-acetyltransferase [uncultured Jatrophihabitans sp.]|uniref:GNAT family N-acetyltransferase n=1 Tax=uncultured Jatrophihabitans sp. TaxID=1610747 RepID=UPI0035CA41EA